MPLPLPMSIPIMLVCLPACPPALYGISTTSQARYVDLPPHTHTAQRSAVRKAKNETNPESNEPGVSGPQLERARRDSESLGSGRAKGDVWSAGVSVNR